MDSIPLRDFGLQNTLISAQVIKGPYLLKTPTNLKLNGESANPEEQRLRSTMRRGLQTV